MSLDETLTINDAGLAGFISYFGRKENRAKLSCRHGKSWIFTSSSGINYWESRYFQSDYAAVNDETIRMLKMRG